MSGYQVVYDALTMPVADPGIVSVAIFGAVAFSAGTVVNWIKFSSSAARRGDRSKEMLGLAIASLAAAGQIAFLIYAGVQTIAWRYAYIHHRYLVLDGCVANFSEVVQPDHDLGVDNFTLQGQPFRLSDSDWRMGYHLSHHHGSPLHEGVHLRAFAQDQRLLRIELAATSCKGS